MMPRMFVRALIAASAAVWATALPAAAQVTTGTVYGTVKDAQGGVIPGVTLVLTSDTRGTKSAPVVTNATGDYVFPNVTADTYTLEATMSGFNVDAAGGHRQPRRPRCRAGAHARSRRCK